MSMRYVSAIFYLSLFYICIGLFLWNYSEFSFQEKIMMWMLIAGFQCLGVLSGRKQIK